MIHPKHKPFNDWQYRSALIAAPVAWAIMCLINPPQFSFTWIQTAIFTFISFILIQPILEEMVFRGLIQGWLISKSRWQTSIMGISYANIITSIAFTGLHFISHPPLMAVAVLIPSLIFGYFRDKYEGWLVPSIFLHCFYNAGYFLLYPPIV